MSGPRAWLPLRSRLRRAVESVPVAGPAAVAVLRAGRRLWSAVRRPRERRPERFLALYKERYGVDDPAQVADPVRRMHVEFALSTVPRGREACERVRRFADLRGRSCLDVGCAYGGFLVAFAEAGARRVAGIDLDPRLLDFARALAKDHRIEAEIRLLDVLAADRAPGLGTFDVVTCNDVIEHVRDPGAALARLASLLAPGGLLYMEVPNRWSAPFVLSDGHYQVFGITALPKPRADRYFDEVKGEKYFSKLNPAITHGVTYKSLPFYVNTMARLGLSCRRDGSPPDDLGARLAAIEETFAECERRLGEPIPGASAESVASLRLHVRRTARAFGRGLARFRSLEGSDASAARRLGETLFVAFGLPFWTLVFQRGQAGAHTVSWGRGIC